MSEPTKEQIKWFWEQCGFYQHSSSYHFEKTEKVLDWCTPEGAVIYQVSLKGMLPRIDLNNLFEYAVPNNWSIDFYFGIAHNCIIALPSGKEFDGSGRSYSEALFWAIYKALGGE